MLHFNSLSTIIALATIALTFPLLTLGQSQTCKSIDDGKESGESGTPSDLSLGACGAVVPNCSLYSISKNNCDTCNPGYNINGNHTQCNAICQSSQTYVFSVSKQYICIPTSSLNNQCYMYNVDGTCGVCGWTFKSDGKGGCTALSLQISGTTFTSYYDIAKDYIVNYESGKNGNQTAADAATAEDKALTDAVANKELPQFYLDQIRQENWSDWCRTTGNSDSQNCANIQ